MPESALLPGRPRPLFGVAASALGRAWVERLDASGAVMATAIAQTHGVPDLLARVLAGRGVSVQATPAFLKPRLRDLLPDPDVLTGMPAAAARLADAAQRREAVAVFGDYDVDGACSAALLAEHLRAYGCPVAIHIPDRITEGYGPNVEAVRRLAAEGARLLVTVDCGTAGHEPLQEAGRLGLAVVVLDHHGAPAELPPALAIVNPNRQDDLSGLGHLCAAGIVFLTLVALARELRRRGAAGPSPPDLLAALDLVALATVADVVPLAGLNRAFVRQGVAVMRSRGRPGLAALMDAARLSGAPDSWHLGFVLGPRINAGGRIGDASLGARLLLEGDPAAAAATAEALDRLNGERQGIERAAVEEADALAGALLLASPDLPALVLSSPDWHPGIVGLVAARLRERHGRPVFAFAPRPDGTVTGSGRSIPGVDLGRAVRAAVTCGDAAKGGGHAMAAGATLAADGLDRFRRCLERELGSAVAALSGEPEPLLVDGALAAGGATPDLVRRLEEAGPFGSGQPEPCFAFGSHRVCDLREIGAGHLRFSLRAGDGTSLKAVAFRAAGQPLGQALERAQDGPAHVAGTLAIDRWGGGERTELRVCDAALP